MASTLFPPLSVAKLAQISTHGGQAVADMAASRQLSQKAVMRGLWYAQRLGTPAERQMAEYATRAVARTGLNFVAQSAGGGLTSAAAGQAAVTSGLLTLFGVVVACALVTALFYSYSVTARVNAGDFDVSVEPDLEIRKPVEPEKESWKTFTEDELRRLRDAQRQDDDDFERSEDPDNFEEEIRRTGY